MMSFIPGETCPRCGHILVYDGGHEGTYDEPSQLPCVYCDVCGMDYNVDWDRYLLYEDDHKDTKDLSTDFYPTYLPI